MSLRRSDRFPIPHVRRFRRSTDGSCWKASPFHPAGQNVGIGLSDLHVAGQPSTWSLVD